MSTRMFGTEDQLNALAQQLADDLAGFGGSQDAKRLLAAITKRALYKMRELEGVAEKYASTRGDDAESASLAR